MSTIDRLKEKYKDLNIKGININEFINDHLDSNPDDKFKDISIAIGNRLYEEYGIPFKEGKRIRFSNNTSGFRGVYLDKMTNEWNVRVNVKRNKIFIDSLVNKKDAVIIRLIADLFFLGSKSRVVKTPNVFPDIEDFSISQILTRVKDTRCDISREELPYVVLNELLTITHIENISYNKSFFINYRHLSEFNIVNRIT